MVLAPRPQQATGRRMADCGTLHSWSETLFFLSVASSSVRQITALAPCLQRCDGEGLAPGASHQE